jgi:hypothetical protein
MYVLGMIHTCTVDIMYVLESRSRGATQVYRLEPRTFPAQGKREWPYLSSFTKER